VNFKHLENPGGELRKLMTAGGVMALGAQDAYAARLAEVEGAQAIYISGYVTEATLLAAPDLGVMTLTELAQHARRIADAVDLPVISDADVGFIGGPINVHRTVRELEHAGLAGIHIEDQDIPKKCPGIPGKKVVDRGEAIARVDTAVRARTNPDFLIIARTDSDIISFDEVVERSNRFLQAGADVAMPVVADVDGVSFDRLEPDDQMERISRLQARIDGPMQWMGAEIPRGYTAQDLFALGFGIVPIAGAGFEAATTAQRKVYRSYLADGNGEAYFSQYPSELVFGRGTIEVLDLERFLAVEERTRDIAASENARM
jgi:2-methylisocitrate lyase-like PEP mutase family enzyme